jgi:hypothetical protein
MMCDVPNNLLSTLGDVQRTLPADGGGRSDCTAALQRMRATLEDMIQADQKLTPRGRNLVCADALADILVEICVVCWASGWSADRVVDRAYHRSKREVSAWGAE